eukprot:scaffold62112_cov23-Cyclotella_meneghiniana.AAC.3
MDHEISNYRNDDQVAINCVLINMYRSNDNKDSPSEDGTIFRSFFEVNTNTEVKVSLLPYHQVPRYCEDKHSLEEAFVAHCYTKHKDGASKLESFRKYGFLVENTLGISFKQFSLEQKETVVKGHSQPSHHCNLVYHPVEDASCEIQTRPTTPSSCRPNYFIAGTRKGGTTSLHTYMAAHPLVYPYKLEGGPQDGESFVNLDGSKAMYNTFVKNLDIPDYQIVGDSTVSRIIDDGLLNFAQNSCHDSKVFLLLRDPVERCYSQMLMRVRLGTNKQKTISKAIQQELIAFQYKVNKYPEIITELWEDRTPLFASAANCMYEGAYVVHLRRLLHKFPRERVRIYWTDDFFADPAGVLRDALKFVGVDPDLKNFDSMHVTSTKYNTKGPEETLSDPDWNLTLPMKLKKEMAEAMRPFDEQLVKFLGDVPPWIRLN